MISNKKEYLIETFFGKISVLLMGEIWLLESLCWHFCAELGVFGNSHFSWCCGLISSRDVSLSVGATSSMVSWAEGIIQDAVVPSCGFTC